MKSSPNQLKTIIFTDFKGKFFAILIGIFLWYYVNVLTVEKIYISLPVTVENEPIDKEVDISTDDLVVRVEISAYEDVSRRITDLAAVIDLSNYEEGKKEYPILLRNLPNDIKAKVSPNYKTVMIYSVITNTIPLNVRVTPNTVLTNVSYTPKNVQIVGSVKEVGKVTSLSSVNLNYKIPMESSLTTNIDIIYPKNIRVLNNQGINVTLHFNQRFYTNQVFLPLEYQNLSENLIITSSNAVVLTLVTSTNDIEDLLLQTVLNIDLTNIFEAGEYSLPLTFNIPTNMVVLDAPTNFDVVVVDTLTNSRNAVYELFGDTVEASLKGLTSNKEMDTESNKLPSVEEETNNELIDNPSKDDTNG